MKRFFRPQKNFKSGFFDSFKNDFLDPKNKPSYLREFLRFFMGESALESLDIIFFEKNILMVPRNFYWRRIFYEGFEWLFSNPFFDMT